MPKGVVAKRCRDCKRRTSGREGRYEICDCGGELVTIQWRRANGNRRRTTERGSGE